MTLKDSILSNFNITKTITNCLCVVIQTLYSIIGRLGSRPTSSTSSELKWNASSLTATTTVEGRAFLQHSFARLNKDRLDSKISSIKFTIKEFQIKSERALIALKGSMVFILL